MPQYRHIVLGVSSNRTKDTAYENDRIAMCTGNHVSIGLSLLITCR